jgi:predicted ATPase
VGVGPPVPLSSLVGRDGEVQEINARVQEHRLVTLTGPGGCGKTRLAVAVAAAAELTTRWLDLAPVDNSGVAAAAASALGLERVPFEDLPAALAAAADPVRGPHLLLVVDNAEHVVAAAATLVAALLARCPGLRVLATSRQPLGVGGELVWAVPALPPPPVDVTPDRLRDFAAARCFLDRVEAAGGHYPSRAETPVVARLCRRLDGMPLALELAAARTTALSVSQLDERLSDALQLLTGGSRTGPDRHRTMRATLDWSYALLAEPERVLLRRLAVFAGSFRLDATEAVCGPGPTLDVLTALVGHSLVTTTRSADGPRFRLLEVVRQYAAQKLADAGEAGELAERHAAHFAGVMRAADTTLRPPVRRTDPRRATLARCEADHADLLAALLWAAGEPSRADRLTQLAASTWWFWWMCGHISTGASWMRRALDAAQAGGLPDDVLVELWHGAGWLSRHLGDHTEAARFLQAAHEGYVAAGDALGESVTAHRLAAVAIGVEPARAVPYLEAGAAAARRAGDDWALACSSY